jgi:DNA-binding GntR family transcriptional regulator
VIRATNLYEKVYERLKREIYEGRFPADAPVLETELAARLGVSRTPVREALRMLASEGLVVPRSGGGHTAVRVGERDLHDAVAARLGVEALAVQLAAERATEAQLDEIDAINRRARASLEAGLLGGTMAANEAFHHAIAAATGSRLIEFLLARVYEFILVSRVLEGVKEQRRAAREMARFIGEHEGIAAALRARDAPLAVARMQAHLATLGDWYQSSLALVPSDPDPARAPAATSVSAASSPARDRRTQEAP